MDDKVTLTTSRDQARRMLYLSIRKYLEDIQFYSERASTLEPESIDRVIELARNLEKDKKLFDKFNYEIGQGK